MKEKRKYLKTSIVSYRSKISNGYFIILFFLTITIVLGACEKKDEVIEAPPLPSGTIINVPADFPTIQLAAENAGINDTIFVASGLYKEHNIQLKAGTHLIGVAGISDSVIIDADSLGRCLLFTGNTYATSIVGFTFQNGTMYSDNINKNLGGGLYIEANSQLTISNCTFYNNDAEAEGGGAHVEEIESLSIIDCEFYNNSAQLGGGIRVKPSGNPDDPYPVSFTDCVFDNNEAGLGGNLFSQGSIKIQNCVFLNGKASTKGGGLYSSGKSALYDCYFKDNVAVMRGGGAYVKGTSSLYENCKWENNKIINLTLCGEYDGGGGLFVVSESTDIKNCVFTNNETLDVEASGGAIRFVSDITIENCTFYSNSSATELGSAIFGILAGGTNFTASLTMQNTIITNGIKGSSVYVPEDMIVTIECTDIWGNNDGDWVGNINNFADQNGNFSLDPQFSNTFLYLEATSPCAPSNNSCNTLIGAMPVQK